MSSVIEKEKLSFFYFIFFFYHLPVLLSVKLLSGYTVGCNNDKPLVPFWRPSQDKAEALV